MMAQSAGSRRIDVLGCPFDAVSLVETEARIAAAVCRGERLHIATANVDFVMQAKRDPEFAKLLWQTDMVVADGVPVLWAARMLGRPLRGRVNGTDLVASCARISADRSFPVALVGGHPAVAEHAAKELRKRFPGSQVHAIATPTPLEDSDTRRIVCEVRRLGARIVLVALGTPAQEVWLARHLPEIGRAVGVGVGGSFDFVSGKARRAPHWMQISGLEWLHRLIRDPTRLARRYLIDDSPFVWHTARASVKRWFSTREGWS